MKTSALSPTRTAPWYGRRSRSWTVAGDRRSVTLSAKQVSLSGAPAASGNMVYYRIAAVHRTGASSSVRYYPDIHAVLPQPVPPKPPGTPLRAATFNVRTAKAVQDPRSWLQRAPDVAAQIARYQPGVVALQELSPSRAEGKKGSAVNRLRQTESLEQELSAIKASRYQWAAARGGRRT